MCSICKKKVGFDNYGGGGLGLESVYESNVW